MKSGTIRAGEARSVIRDAIVAKKLSPAVWSFSNGAFHFLVGSQQVDIVVPAGQSFYGLRQLIAQIERICDEVNAARARKGQLDIEDAIRAAAK